MNYVPFIKGKQNEFLALRALSAVAQGRIKPFIDIPRGDDNTAPSIEKKIKTAFVNATRMYKVSELPFYIDVFDLPAETFVNGVYVYEYVLDVFSGFDITPVLGLDRDDEHTEAVVNHVNLEGGGVALRLLPDDIDSFNLTKGDVEDVLCGLPEGTMVDVIIDLRVITDDVVEDILPRLNLFLSRINEIEDLNKVIITSSSIPPVVTELTATGSENHIDRAEWDLWQGITHREAEGFIYGDYTVVSPEYSDSDIAVELMRTVQTPRIIYTKNDGLYIARGRALKTHGDSQYFNLARMVKSCGFYRTSNSEGEVYIEDVASRNVGKCGNASKWIATTVACHIEHFSSI